MRYEAARDIAKAVVKPTVIVTKSTVPVGTGDAVELIMSDTRPEFALPARFNP